jgi:hypothetical protein
MMRPCGTSAASEVVAVTPSRSAASDVATMLFENVRMMTSVSVDRVETTPPTLRASGL